MKIPAFITVRSSSTRLPEKCFLPFGTGSVLEHVIRRVKHYDLDPIVCTTTEVTDDTIIELAKKCNVKFFRGPVENKLLRWSQCCEHFDLESFHSIDADDPFFDSKAIKKLADHLNKNSCEIATLASKLDLKKDAQDENVCKVETREKISQNSFAEALDFYRMSKNVNFDFTYHHIGIYAFTNKALIRYVSLKRSKLEVKRNLEQLRALENKMKIDVGYTEDLPLSVDTEDDFLEVKKIMENK